MAWELEAPARRVAEILWSEGQQRLPAEIMRMDDGSAALIVDLDGVDYCLLMVRVPRQRPRPASN
ncbi:hypothetical protein [Cereibacter azotoformans]|uniref:Uncharacterized protein n=1 Tax=Cereibacter azotoformans TaxID=43057 RepID=A0A2T5JSG7_9RHOB|nr:hypothetical protein [Cereibacter azotoformans]MBO4168885.1 hypothetical protein [Cereibacter azotoformans]PTR11161.1 hypothetical protein C8J28_12822 [Cereibacter azotoformans]